MWKEYYVAALLFLNGVWDWKKREVCLPSILVSLAAGLVGACWYQELSIRDLAGGLGIGVGMMVLAFLTKGAVGLGDGWLLCATGVLLGMAGNFELLLMVQCSAQWSLAAVCCWEKPIGRIPFPLSRFYVQRSF